MLLQNMALRYAARDLDPNETVAFETRLANDQGARDALSEAVRLSAAALGRAPPAPHSSFRSAIRERLLGWCPGWLARRAYRGHPLAWAGLGAAAVAVCAVFGLYLTEVESKRAATSTPKGATAQSANVSELKDETSDADSDPEKSETMAIAPMPRDRGVLPPSVDCNDEHACKPSVAQIWAELSTPDHVEKAHEEELRWRHKLREMGAIHPGRPAATASINEPREP
jgi:hypothetical protein